jgi:hypothetical protein
MRDKDGDNKDVLCGEKYFILRIINFFLSGMLPICRQLIQQTNGSKRMPFLTALTNQAPLGVTKNYW